MANQNTYGKNAGPSGALYNEYYLYSNKAWEMAPSGVSFYNLRYASLQNAPVVVTASGMETTTSTDPWAQITGSGKYEKVGYGYFTLLPNGQYNQNSYEFAVHPDSSGKLVFNGLLKENVFIEYESGASGYYIMENIDYNPVRSEVQGGFVHFSQTTDPTNLFLSASQNSIRADGFQGCTLTSTLYDESFDRVPEKTIVFEIQKLLPATGPLGYTTGTWSELGKITPNAGTITSFDASGVPIIVEETTNRRGEAHVHYVTNDRKTGIVQIKAYYKNPNGASGIFDIAGFAQYYMTNDPFTLDISLLDTLDYLTGDIYNYVP